MAFVLSLLSISSTYLSKNVHLKYSFIKKTCKNVQKHASHIFWDPTQKHASSKPVQLEAVQLKALLYMIGWQIFVIHIKYLRNQVVFMMSYKISTRLKKR
jgi:hypothetical protein